MQLIDLRCDSTHRPTVTPRDPSSPSRVFEKMVLGGEAQALFQIQRCHPVRVSGVDTMGDGQKRFELVCARYFFED
ncbi:MAG: hypothetical protein PVF93_01060 [Chromatiaceae bacterium]